MKRTRLGLVFIGLLLLAGPAFAQLDSGNFERSLEQIRRERELRVSAALEPGQRALLEMGGFGSFNFFSFEDSSDETRTLRETDLNLYTSLNLDDVHQFYVQTLARYDDWGTGDNPDRLGDESEFRLERALYRFDLARYRSVYEGEETDINLVAIGGRQLVHWFNGLVLSQVIDGGILRVETDTFTLEGLGGVSRPESVDFDSSRPDFNRDTVRGFYGGFAKYRPVNEHELYVFGLIQKDLNDKDFDPDPLRFERTTNPGLPTLPTRFHYDSYYVGGGAKGSIGDNLTYGVEAVYQWGEGLSNSFAGTPAASIPQTFEDIEAWALDVRFDYFFQDVNDSRMTLEVVVASGDDDRINTSDTFGGNLSGTNDTAFNGFGLINTGLAFAPSVSNLFMIRGGASTKPLPDSELFKEMQIGTNLFVFMKTDSDAPVNELTTNDRYLGFESDFFVNWQVASDVTLSTRYGLFFPGDAIVVDQDVRQFLFSSVTVTF